MTAGVQNIDSAAYLPPPPSTSTSEAKGTGVAGKQGTDPQAAGTPGEPSDFQSELAMQQTGQQGTDPAGRTGSAPTGPTQTGATKTGSDKSGKKRDARPDDASPSALTPVQVAEPQKPILPFSLAQPQPQEHVQADQNAKPDQQATPHETTQGPAQQSAQVLSPSLAAVAQLPELRQPVALKQSMKFRQSAPPVEALAKQTAASNTIPPAATDPGKLQILPLAPVPATTQDTSLPPGPKPEDPASQDQAQSQSVTSAKSGASSGNQPILLAELKLPAAPPEPVASAVQETVDSAPSSPSAMAFAARISAAQQKADQPVTANAGQIPAVSGSQTPDQIPMRYAATAQIIQSAAVGTQQDGTKKDPGDSGGRFARPDARTDMVLPRFEASSEPVPSSASQAPQQPASAARPESILEPPAAPPTSSHDIRVQVPDNNGGSTQVRFVESGGEVRVSVRTADAALAQNLRTHLNDLTQRLSDGGTPAEIWKPAANAASSQNDSQQQSQPDGRGSGGQGSGGQGGQQDRQQKRPAWLEEMEASLHAEQN
jgi:hypothetical protein